MRVGRTTRSLSDRRPSRRSQHRKPTAEQFRSMRTHLPIRHFASHWCSPSDGDRQRRPQGQHWASAVGYPNRHGARSADVKRHQTMTSHVRSDCLRSTAARELMSCSAEKSGELRSGPRRRGPHPCRTTKAAAGAWPPPARSPPDLQQSGRSAGRQEPNGAVYSGMGHRRPRCANARSSRPVHSGRANEWHRDAHCARTQGVA